MAHSFVWYELMTRDPAAAADYYAKVVGWTVELMPGGAIDMEYRLLKLGDRPVAGVMGFPDGAGPKPLWFGYVAVEDVDAAAARFAAGGGTIHKGPADIPDVGRFAVVADPQGATIMLFKANGPAPEPLPLMSTGIPGWHELHTGDAEAAFAFYAGQFGWEKDETLETPMGPYQIIKAGVDYPNGAVIKSEHNFWLFYFAVDDIDAATARITEHGGARIHGPQEVPGGAWITLASDPQGAMFAVVGMRKA